LQHVCFAARGVDALADRAREAGFTIIRGPGPGPYGHTVYLLDPDGREIELAETDEV
jgi:catechol 2,3-dioxygenase-like lactoylglutathione lyase family enzyme